ncbi:2-oxoisovalerate dehydrogenase E1 subunit beta [Acidithiobacillus sp. M4-SHS-6]|uniref:2-oxoisovalerate dehydrogenase E1 subunit beta n=1 Tax=Acidithiobacillus sp. M4-SHS-6 TaxID=3383024 RepID=UPI0039BDD92E
MTEIHFIVEQAPEGGYVARAIGADIFTESENIEGLHAQVRDAVHCHFDPEQMPRLIRLHITREEVLVA